MALVPGAQERLGDVEIGPVVARQAPRGAFRGQALQLRPHEIDVAALLRAEAAHDGAPVPELIHQADRLQLAQRLAHGRAAHAEAGGEILLAQPRPERDAARDDLDLQPAGEVVGA